MNCVLGAYLLKTIWFKHILSVYFVYIEQLIKTYNDAQWDSEESLQTYTNLYPI